MKTQTYFGRVLGALLLYACCSFSLSAKVTLPALVSDGMVLQREVPLKIWGTACPGEKVNLTFMKKQYHTVADEAGNWTIGLPALKAGGPYSMSINDITLKEILVGDVFLCSGQSNMELTVNRVMDKYAEEIASYENSSVRYVKIPYAYDFLQPLNDLQAVKWQPMTQEYVQSFSALCYFFSKLLEEKTGVPVGIINSSWGGTPIEAWISEEGLKDFPAYVNQKTLYEDAALVAQIKETEQLHQSAWNKQLYRSDVGLHGEMPWYAESYNDTDWEWVDMFSDNWALRNGRPLNGTHWFRKEFVVPDGWAGKDVVLRLGCMVDADSVYVNGHFVGSVSYQYPPRVYQVPAKYLKKGKNQLTVRLFSYGSCPSFVKEKPYKLLCGNQEINLEGRWKHKIGTVMPPSPSSTAFHYTPVGLYNGMIHPLQHYVFKGVVWYQGESNVDRWREYSSLLTAMIADWRALFQNENLPFYVVELADFLAPNDPGRAAWAELRKQQAKAAQESPCVTLIKNSDTGEWNDIHPLDKKTPATRLVNAVIQNEKQNK
ncbi:sialate O-acetylesterase [uncultured Bacteroides sp.]|uniref:sialate O-acetylesterase n=1 Tax=uncultured Bacteroides sp. TaxID=162156 RepID=UPI00280B1459|nr:sialate O-acetylesterase [uncultured Bacteroides sp.]